MSTATVYRVQDSEGRGPFRPGVSMQWVIGRHDLCNLQPSIVEFPFILQLRVNAIEQAYGCACVSKKQLRRWFIKREYQTLLALGYRAVEMQVYRIIAKSKIQCVFTRTKPLNRDVRFFDLYR